MMLRLLAFTPEDGWALVADGVQRWLLQPPYRGIDRRALTDEAAVRALFEEQFATRDDEFEGWGDLTRKLLDERRAYASDDQCERARDAAEKVLRRASRDDVEMHLKTVGEWIERRRLDAAERALTVLLMAPSVSAAPDLVRRVAELMRSVKEHQRKPIEVDAVQSPWRVADTARLRVVERAIEQRGGLLFSPSAA